MVALTKEYGVEFSLIYRRGAGKGGGGGKYYLYSGKVDEVPVPINSDVIWIYHTHPGGTIKASNYDQFVLQMLRERGSPQRTSRVIPAKGPQEAQAIPFKER